MVIARPPTLMTRGTDAQATRLRVFCIMFKMFKIWLPFLESHDLHDLSWCHRYANSDCHGMHDGHDV